MALVVAYSSKSDRDQNVGFIETFYGLGFLFGPMFGSIMFSLGGYTMPFLSCGIVLVICLPIIMFNLFRAKQARL